MAIKAGRISFWAALASGTGYLALMAYFNFASPSPNVDYSVAMNQKAASLPEDQRAWSIYRDAWAKFELSDGGKNDWVEHLFAQDEDGNYYELVRPQDEDWDDAIEKLKASSELLDALRAGSELDHLGLELHVNISKYTEKDFRALFPDRHFQAATDQGRRYFESIGIIGLSDDADQLLSGGLINIPLPHTQSFRTATSILQVDTRYAVTQNAPERVVENIKSMFGFARQQKNENILVCNLVGVAVFKTALAQIEELVRETPGFLKEAHLAELQTEIEKFDFSKVDFSVERALRSDLLQRIYTDDGNGDGRLTSEGLEIIEALKRMYAQFSGTTAAATPWTHSSPLARSIFGPALMVSAPGRKEVSEMDDTLFEEVESRFGTPWWQDDLSELKQKPTLEDSAVIPIAGGDLTSIHASFQNTIAHQDAGRLGIAIERFRLKSGSWPTSINDLMGSYLKTQPLDRVTGKPLLFKASDESVIIYSVGGDLDDDGGKHDTRTNPLISETYDDSVDGDWVLWPIDRE